jgi:hypothetical protein
MCEGVTSDEDKISREVPEAEVQLANEEAPTFGEVPSSMERRPLRRWVPRIPVGGRHEIEQYHPSVPKGWVLRTQHAKVGQFLFCPVQKLYILGSSAWIELFQDFVEPLGDDPGFGEGVCGRSKPYPARNERSGWARGFFLLEK